jgi:hypothetical protein
MLVEAGRVLQSSSHPIDPRLRNNLLHSRFDPVKLERWFSLLPSRKVLD